MSRKIVIASFAIFAGAAFMLTAHERPFFAGGMMDGGMMGGGMMGGGMRGGGMMGQTPESNGSQALPDQQSKQAQLFKRYCSQCHALPSPRAHTAQDWPSVVARMKHAMMTQGKAPPDNEQLEEIVEYLQRHAK